MPTPEYDRSHPTTLVFRVVSVRSTGTPFIPVDTWGIPVVLTPQCPTPQCPAPQCPAPQGLYLTARPSDDVEHPTSQRTTPPPPGLVPIASSLSPRVHKRVTRGPGSHPFECPQGPPRTLRDPYSYSLRPTPGIIVVHWRRKESFATRPPGTHV